ncbi:MAG TPA: metalloregulator ArsR/SmtB family transcription factor [Acidimicrobiales bacterium]|jgi:DNA-binding transcriptional ArsR family regulator|nr:metalloregulator ArsR/SmtB family transcription factor [Acidimicrobiales bacterium]
MAALPTTARAGRGPAGAPPDPAGGDADLAAVGSLLADRTRCRILLALTDGRALPASMLAEEAGVAASTASSHLGRLTDAGLVTVVARGRYRYYRLAGPEVGAMIEAVGRLAPAEPVRSLRQGTRAYQLRRARTCYDHLAGRLGVALTDQLESCGGLSPLAPAGTATDRPDGPVGHGSVNGAADQPGYRLEPAGTDLLNRIGAELEPGSWVRACVDWTEQRPHIAGVHGRALLGRLLELAWVERSDRSRAVEVTDAGRAGLRDWIGLEIALDRTG